MKITDFGISCYYDKKNPPTEFAGTPKYMPPEIKLNKKYIYDERIDVWSLGMIAYELLSNG